MVIQSFLKYLFDVPTSIGSEYLNHILILIIPQPCRKVLIHRVTRFLFIIAEYLKNILVEIFLPFCDTLFTDFLDMLSLMGLEHLNREILCIIPRSCDYLSDNLLLIYITITSEEVDETLVRDVLLSHLALSIMIIKMPGFIATTIVNEKLVSLFLSSCHQVSSLIPMIFVNLISQQLHHILMEFIQLLFHQFYILD